MNSRIKDQLRWFQDASFGMIIHWGLYAVPAGVWKGKKIPSLGEWIMSNAKIPVDEYSALTRKFNPVQFDADEWVSIAKNAGMKYIVITAKHADGFAMFKSGCDPFNIVDATPYKRDILADLAQACKKAGIKLGFYYSQSQDWHEPHAAHTMARRPEGAAAGFAEYLARKVKPQLRELLTNYGKIALIWFDTPAFITPAQSKDLEKFVHGLQPHCLVNSRIGNKLGDYSCLGDNIIPFGAHKGILEVPATMNDTWGYKKTDHRWRSLPVLLQTLFHLAGKGVNYLLNVGPTAEGIIPRPSVQLLKGIGKWMKINGAAIYDSRPDPYQQYEFEWGMMTQKPGWLFFIITKHPGKVLTLYGLKNRVKNAFWLADRGHSLAFEQTVDKTRAYYRLDVWMTRKSARELFPVLAVSIDGKAETDGQIWPQTSGAIYLPVTAAGVHNPPDSMRPWSICCFPFGGVHQIPGEYPDQYWTHPDESWMEWGFKIAEPGRYKVKVILAWPTRCIAGDKITRGWFAGNKLVIRCADQKLTGITHARRPVQSSRSWYFTEYETDFGTLQLRQRGDCRLTLEGKSFNKNGCLLFAVELTPIHGRNSATLHQENMS